MDHVTGGATSSVNQTMESPLVSPAISNHDITWRDVLHEERLKEYFQNLHRFVATERAAEKPIYPPSSEVFAALRYTPLASVRVVILGQDPYHGSGQAHGLCFSVRPGTPFPPSLQNIFKELRADLGVPMPQTGCLLPWARQGVLLLNAVLTVEEGKPGSHANRGWERFTDKVIEAVVTHRTGVVFLLWGSYAQKKATHIASSTHTHHILTAPHPSPLSAHRGFFGCRHFSEVNRILVGQGGERVDWAAVGDCEHR